jgi:hypothetical protein
LAPGSTPVPTKSYSYNVGGTGSPVIIGDITQVPPAKVNGSVVLFSNGNVTVTMATKFTNTTVLLADAQIKSAAISFSILYLSGPANVAVILSDEDGNYGGNSTKYFAAGGQAIVDITQLYTDLLNEYKKSFTLARAIRGNILKVSLGVVTDNVAIEIDPASVAATTVYSVDAIQATTTSAPAIPTTTKGSLSNASTTVVSMIAVVISLLIFL